jgi:hypothetical protein
MARTLGRCRKSLTIVACVGATIFGIVAPAFAEGHFYTTNNRWENGDRSDTWTDHNQDGTDTHATFAAGCSQEFRARIRKENFGPDTTVASEFINCQSYTDAVRAGDVAADQYHFDINDLDLLCLGGSCVSTFTDVSRVDVYW